MSMSFFDFFHRIYEKISYTAVLELRTPPLVKNLDFTNWEKISNNKNFRKTFDWKLQKIRTWTHKATHLAPQAKMYTNKRSFKEISLFYRRRRRNIWSFLHTFWAILQSKTMISQGKTQIHLKIFAQSKSQNRPKQGGVFLLRGGFLIKVTTDRACQSWKLPQKPMIWVILRQFPIIVI